MPPARLPARIDRSGLGGGSFFSPAAEEGSVLATGAVATATEAMLVRSTRIAHGCRLWPTDRLPPSKTRCSVASNEARAQQQLIENRAWIPVPRGGHDRRRAETHFEARGRVGSGGRRARLSIALIYRHRDELACCTEGRVEKNGSKVSCVIPNPSSSYSRPIAGLACTDTEIAKLPASVPMDVSQT